MIDKRRPRKLNATADSRLRKEDEMQDALNIVSTNDFRVGGETTEGNDDTGNAGVLKPVRGNTPIPPFEYEEFLPTTKKRVLGSVTDHAHDVIYFFVWVEDAEDQGVYAYDPTGYLPGSEAGNEAIVKVFTSNMFRFPSDGFIKADVVHINKPIEISNSAGQTRAEETRPVLYFTDNVNEPRKLHVFRALIEADDLEDYDPIDIEDFITACPKTPLYPITAQFERDATDATTAFEGLPGFQFAYQHVYKGGEESALSTFSDIAVPQAYYRQGSSASADLYANNRCVLTIPHRIQYVDEENQVLPDEEVVRTREIASVRILSRVGNSGTWGVVDEVPVEELEAGVYGGGVGGENKYFFYNRSVAAGFPAQTAIKPYDNLPQKAQAQAVVSDRLAYGNYVEGYDNMKVTASATVVYHNRPEDFKELDIRIIPTIKKSSEGNAGEVDWGATINKRTGWYLDVDGLPNSIDKGSAVQMDFSVKPMRNFHFYNGINSFHGSRHLSLELAEEGGDPYLEGIIGPEVHGLGATEAETRGSEQVNKDMNHMFGANNGIGIPGLKWNVTDSQSENEEVFGEHDVVFGTSAANPFILRGASLHFGVNLKLKNDTNRFVLRRVICRLLTTEIPLVDEDGNPTDNPEIGIPDGNLLLTDFEASLIEVVNVRNHSIYQIDEGLPGGGDATDPEKGISAPFEIPVATGSDDRKHLICALGNKSVVNLGATEFELTNQSPCGYFIVNRAEVDFNLHAPMGHSPESGFLELNLNNLTDIDIQTAIPFMNAERWKDELYWHKDDGCWFDGDEATSLWDGEVFELNRNDPMNWGLRDATLWSLDSLIVDSWFCYSREYLESNNLNSMLFTPSPTDFPRYMNGSADSDINPGDPNPSVTNNGKGKNCCVLDFQARDNYMFDKAVQDYNTNAHINDYYAYRRDALFLAGFKQSWKMPFFQCIAVDEHATMGQGGAFLTWKSHVGRNQLIGYFTTTDIYDFENETKSSLMDGCMGPGGARDGLENIRRVSGGETDYAVGSVTGEMIFTGRISPMGYFRPEMPKSGKKQQVGGDFERGFHRYFNQYGLGPVLPYFGGVGYQKIRIPGHGPADGFFGANFGEGPFSKLDIGFIVAWFWKGKANCNQLEDYDMGSLNISDYHEGQNLLSGLEACYVGDDNNSAPWLIVDEEDDLRSSIRVGDAPISLTGRELGIYGGDEWKAGGRSFKTRANHAFGIVYYDERGRSGKVNPLLFTDSENSDAPPSPGVYIKGYSPNERGDVSKNGRVSIDIDLSNQDPPEWAFNYQIVYGGNTTKSNFIQYSVGGAFIANKNLNEESGEEGEDPNSTNIYVSLNYLQGNVDVSYSEAFGAVSPLGVKDLYTYKPGDKLRVLSYYRRPDARVWAENVEFDIIGVVNVSNDPEKNIFRRAFELDDDNDVVADCRTGQFLVLKNNRMAEGFNYSSVKAGFNEAHTNAHKWNNICVVEIYSPAMETDIEDKLFYEIGEVHPIRRRIDEASGESSLHHHAITPDGEEEIITLDKGDVWFKPVALATPEWGYESISEGGDPLPAYNTFGNLIRRGLGRASSSPRFKNYYVESLTFNDTFAGNNVTGIGKPNNIDKDVMQIRKSSSIIHSDKHNFAQKGIKFTSFNGTTSNWKDLPGEFGKINFLQNNYDSLICIQENKSSTIPVERNIISDASGANTLITTNKVIGVQAFYAGEYGCDNNPESVLKNDAATYFASKAKSEVYRLTAQGIEVISKTGLSSYFFRIFEVAKNRALNEEGRVYVPSGYDPLKDEFLITISNLMPEPTTGEVSLAQGQYGAEFIQIPGCMDDTACNYNPDANIDDGSCVYYEIVYGCTDRASLDYNPQHYGENSCVVFEGDDSLCDNYFDFCIFDTLSESPDGIITTEDIYHAFNVLNMGYGANGADADGNWNGLTGADAAALGLDLQWLWRQTYAYAESVDAGVTGQASAPTLTTTSGQVTYITGGTFRMGPWDSSPMYTLPMEFTGSGGPQGASFTPTPGWNLQEEYHRIKLMQAILQMLMVEAGLDPFIDEGLPGCPIYGCTTAGSNSPNYNPAATNDAGDMPQAWLDVINNSTYADVDDDELPWNTEYNGSFGCEEGESELDLG